MLRILNARPNRIERRPQLFKGPHAAIKAFAEHQASEKLTANTLMQVCAAQVKQTLCQCC